MSHATVCNNFCHSEMPCMHVCVCVQTLCPSAPDPAALTRIMGALFIVSPVKVGHFHCPLRLRHVLWADGEKIAGGERHAHSTAGGQVCGHVQPHPQEVLVGYGPFRWHHCRAGVQANAPIAHCTQHCVAMCKSCSTQNRDRKGLRRLQG